MACENVKAADTNATSLAVTKDETIDASTVWLYQEPNEISSFAASIEKVARDPISIERQRRKGAVTSVTASPQFVADMTLEMIHYFMPGFLFSVWKGLQPESYEVTAVTAATDTYTVTTGDAILTAGTLVHATGFINPENNGLKEVVSGTATTVVVPDGLVDEAPPSTVKLYVAGQRGDSGDLQIDADGNLISTTLDFTSLGLTVGQYIKIGGSDTANQFDTAANNSKARISVISANKLELEAKDATFVTDAGAGKEIDLYFSAFCRNVPVGDVDFNKQFYQMEVTYNTDPTLYEYAECNINNTLAINNSVSDKATLDLAFVGKDIPAPVDTPKDGTRVNQTAVEPFNTAADITRLRVADVDDTGVTTFFKDTNISINNNVSPEYILGQLGAEFVNFGNFEVDIDTETVFTDAVVLSAIRNNTTYALDMAYENNDGGFVLSFPSGTFSDGSKNLARNEKVKITSPFEAHYDADIGYTMGVSMFWYLP